ncbi:1-phosphatidylinositol-3-phosphate 5-kinase, partial [Pyrenophora tritici-repentis]
MARDSRRGSLQPSLHQMHAVASRSDTLTTFDDFTVPPAPSVVGEPKGIELVQGGFSGLYSRLRASVGGGSREQAQDGSGNGVSRTGTPPAAGNRNSPGGTSTSSPQLVALPPSRLQSPATATFPETLPPSRDSNISSTTFSSKASRSRPSISASIEPGPAKQDEVYIKSPVSIHSKNHSTSTIDLPRSNTPRDSALGSQKVDSPRFSRENAAPRQQ